MMIKTALPIIVGTKPMTVKRTMPPIGAPWRGQRNRGNAANVRIDIPNAASGREFRSLAGSATYDSHVTRTPTRIASVTAANVSAAM
jgi:hypothetical protein